MTDKDRFELLEGYLMMLESDMQQLHHRFGHQINQELYSGMQGMIHRMRQLIEGGLDASE